MSNQKLRDAVIPGYAGPFFPPALDQLQEAYVVRRHNKRPIDQAFLKYFGEELALFFKRVNVRPNFNLLGIVNATSVSLLYVNDVKCRIVFPETNDKKHLNGTVSAHHVALYIDNSDEEPDEKMIEPLARAINQLVGFDLTQFYS
ncbi:hypothetical protein BH11PAT2_BH11PAT2_06430 [soil metagenome]